HSAPCCPISASSVCSHRLAVRTPPSHGGNRGSIPLGSTKFFRHLAEFLKNRRISIEYTPAIYHALSRTNHVSVNRMAEPNGARIARRRGESDARKLDQLKARR